MFAMNTGTITALIAASSAILGGLLAAFATRSVETLRLRASLRQAAEARTLQVLQRFSRAAFSWFEWLTHCADTRDWSDANMQENNRRSAERQEAYRDLLLLSSDELFEWLTSVYQSLEYQFNQQFTTPLRRGEAPPESANEVRRQYARLLRDDLIARFRPELTGLRNPEAVSYRWSFRSHHGD